MLVVDDDAGIRDTVKWILEYEGYRVETAFDGVDALEKLQEVRPGLILLDLMMPRMDGETLAQTIRRDRRLQTIPILVLSAFPCTPEIQAELGIQGYLEKPFDVGTLVHSVDYWMNMRSQS